MEKYTNKQLQELVINSGRHLWIATDLMRLVGINNPNSQHSSYPRAKRVLKALESAGILHSRFFPQVGLTVYWRIP